MKSFLTLALVLALLLIPVTVVAHPGRTDTYGCHSCKTNCTSWGYSYGEYHCHNPKSNYKSNISNDSESSNLPGLQFFILLGLAGLVGYSIKRK